MDEMDRLRAENRDLRREIERLRSQLAERHRDEIARAGRRHTHENTR